MKRILVACVAAGLGAHIVLAAAPEIEAAIKTLQAVGADPGKLKTFCELNKIMQAVGKKEDPDAEKQMEDIAKRLGPEFETAWYSADELDETSPDAQAFYTAADALGAKCP